MSTDLNALREQARLTYRYWPIYLVLRLREIEQHLSDEERASLALEAGPPPPNLTLLQRYHLWGDATPALDPPNALAVPDEATLCFEVDDTSNSARLQAVATAAAEAYRLDLLAAPVTYRDHLAAVAQQLHQMMADHDAQTAFDAARLWAALHGARALSWEVSSLQSATTHKGGRLPTRRRGRGQYRLPYGI